MCFIVLNLRTRVDTLIFRQTARKCRRFQWRKLRLQSLNLALLSTSTVVDLGIDGSGGATEGVDPPPHRGSGAMPRAGVQGESPRPPEAEA